MLGNAFGWRARAWLGVRVIALGALVASATAACAGTAPVRHLDPSARLVATTADGAVRGTTTAGPATDEFLGIP